MVRVRSQVRPVLIGIVSAVGLLEIILRYGVSPQPPPGRAMETYASLHFGTFYRGTTPPEIAVPSGRTGFHHSAILEALNSSSQTFVSSNLDENVRELSNLEAQVVRSPKNSLLLYRFAIGLVAVGREYDHQEVIAHNGPLFTYRNGLKWLTWKYPPNLISEPDAQNSYEWLRIRYLLTARSKYNWGVGLGRALVKFEPGDLEVQSTLCMQLSGSHDKAMLEEAMKRSLQNSYVWSPVCEKDFYVSLAYAYDNRWWYFGRHRADALTALKYVKMLNFLSPSGSDSRREGEMLEKVFLADLDKSNP